MHAEAPAGTHSAGTMWRPAASDSGPAQQSPGPDGASVVTALDGDTAEIWCSTIRKCLPKLAGHGRLFPDVSPNLLAIHSGAALAADGDGNVNFSDFLILSSNFGKTAGAITSVSGDAESSAVDLVFAMDGSLLLETEEDGSFDEESLEDLSLGLI